MLGFWEQREANRNIFIYLLAPILHEIGFLLIGASRLWYPWSAKRAKMLETMGYETEDTANSMRKRGLGWAGNLGSFDGDFPGSTLHNFAFHRYHGDKKIDASPQAAAFLANAAVRFLFAIRPQFEKIESFSWKEHGHWVKNIDHMLEDLLESPLIGKYNEIPAAVLEIFARHALFLECAGLAHMQARIEDDANESSGEKRKKHKSDLSDAEIHNLAADIGMPFETVKDVMETEFSSWWDRTGGFETMAKQELEKLLVLVKEGSAKTSIRLVLAPPMTTDNMSGGRHYTSKTDAAICEKVINTFICLFLSFRDEVSKDLNLEQLSDLLKPLQLTGEDQ